MHHEEIIAGLQGCAEFQQQFALADLKRLAKYGRIETYEAGEEVFSTHHDGDSFYIVLSGQLLLRLRTNKTRYFNAGDMFGEIAMFAHTKRLGTVRALTPCRLIAFDRTSLFEQEAITCKIRLKLYEILTRKIVGYFYTASESNSLELIAKGESESVEFKTSPEKPSVDPMVCSLAGFMNLCGGTLFVGVNDNGKIQGVPVNKDLDEFKTLLSQQLKARLGAATVPLVHFDLEDINGKQVLRIDCDPSDKAVFYKDMDKEHNIEREFLIVRNGPSNTRLRRPSEVVAYLQKRLEKRC